MLGNVDSVRKRALPALRKALCSAFHPRAHTDWLAGLAGRRYEVQAEQRAQFLLYPASSTTLCHTLTEYNYDVLTSMAF